MKSPFWWLRNDRIGRSRLVVLCFAILCALGSVVIGWPSPSTALIVALLSVVLVIGDYLFWRYDLRRTEKSEDDG